MHETKRYKRAAEKKMGHVTYLISLSLKWHHTTVTHLIPVMINERWCICVCGRL